MTKITAFSLADQLDEAGRVAVARRSDGRKHERVIHYEAAQMIRSLAVKLHKQQRITAFYHYCAIGFAMALLAVALLGVQ